MKCRVTSIIPPTCLYSSYGIDSARLLDIEDLIGVGYSMEGLYETSVITNISRNSDFIEIATPEGAKHTATLQNGVYSHTLETFISDLSGGIISNLHLASKRRQLVTFRGKNGRFFCFGIDTGAVLRYDTQTDEQIGAVITLSAQSRYPLFEVTPEAFLQESVPSTFKVDFEQDAYCENNFTNVNNRI